MLSDLWYLTQEFQLKMLLTYGGDYFLSKLKKKRKKKKKGKKRKKNLKTTTVCRLFININSDTVTLMAELQTSQTFPRLSNCCFH